MSTGDVAEPVWTVADTVPREVGELPATRPQRERKSPDNVARVWCLVSPVGD